MLNAEKHKVQLLKFVEENHDSLFGLDKNNEPISCTVSRCNNCQFGFKKSKYVEGYSCSAAKIKWLLSEYKEPVKLTKLEFELLKFWHKQGYKYIARDRDNTLFIYKDKPSKLAEYWANLYHYSLDDNFRNLFEFVEWEDKEPTSIKDVLKKCEVVEDD